MTKYIFVTGGVMSSVGKGVATSSIGKILQARGYTVSLIKCDMYVNIDAGTMRPTEHGEVFVGEDGIEADQDLGTYERFVNQVSTKENYITTGQVYAEVIRRERNLEYKGEDVEVVPDIPNEILRRIELVRKKDKSDFLVVEIGGTVGEYQNILFLEAARMLKLKRPKDVLFVLVSYLPIPGKIGEMKTKPTQYASRTLNSVGIQADFILCRSEQRIDEKRKEKLAIFCNIEKEAAIAAPDVDNVYEVPLNFVKDELDLKILKRLGLKPREKDMKEWAGFVGKAEKLTKPVNIGIVGKYFDTGDFTLADSYISVIESLKFACWANGVKPELTWLSAEKYDPSTSSGQENLKELKKFHGILIPGGFGSRGTEGKIQAIRFCRENNVPYFGLCLGLQLAVIEFARNVCGLKDATSTEFEPKAKTPVIDVMPEQKALLEEKHYGATMRLGAYPCQVQKGTLAYKAYGAENIVERHRHRYEVNNEYRKILQEKGMVMSGINKERDLVEIVELKNHPFFLGTQFHPEFKSRPLQPHPLFLQFVKACVSS
ncbi:MAG TPA: CTP synthase [Candidatus Paceibacterota bacterium]